MTVLDDAAPWELCTDGDPHEFGVLEQEGTGRTARGCQRCGETTDTIARREEEASEIDGLPFVNTEPLVCHLCGSTEPKLGALPVPAGAGWKVGVSFHPGCRRNLERYGAR